METADHKNDKIAAISCPRIAALKENKKELVYKVTTYAGANEKIEWVVNGSLCKARFYKPSDITITPDNTFYISDMGNSNIRKITPEGTVSTFAGNPEGGDFSGGFADGVGTEAKFGAPRQTVLNKDGHMYVLDQGGIAIRKVSLSASVTTYLDLHSRPTGGYGDGILAEAKFRWFNTLISHPNGSLFVADVGNGLIREITTEGMVSTYAGTRPIDGIPQSGFRDGQKDQALFGNIIDMAFAPNGDLYLCDRGNKRLRKITTTGQFETVAEIDADYLTVDPEGNVYASGKTKIFKITSAGDVTVIAGSDTPEHKDGVGTAAKFTEIRRLIVKDNYLYIADGFTIRRMTIK